MPLNWKKLGDNHSREYHAVGRRGRYVIDLDPPPVDRWFISVDGVRCVEDVYYIDKQDNAKGMVGVFENSGAFRPPSWPFARSDGRRPRIIVADGVSKSPSATVTRQSSATPPLTKSPPPSAIRAAEQLVEIVRRLRLRPYIGTVDWLPWHSGVYALVDCVFSAQASYEATVLPMLQQRLPRRLADTPLLTYSQFLRDVDSFGPNKFQRYAAEVLTRQVLSGRLKVEVAYDAARFLASRGYETLADLQGAEPTKLEQLILGSLVPTVRGIGPTLGEYLLILVGDETRIKLDTQLTQFLQRELHYVPDPATARSIFNAAARSLGTTAGRLENAIWRYESGSSR